MNYIVYKTTNIINGKIYIGVHKTANPNVFDGYIGNGVTSQKSATGNTKFHNAVRKYGYENFKREIIEIFPGTNEGCNDAYQLEAKLVNEDFIKRKDVYNMALGGYGQSGLMGCTKVLQYSLDGKFIKLWDSIKEAEEYYNTKGIYDVCIGRTHQLKGFAWRYYDEDTIIEDIGKIKTKNKTVYQYDLQGNLLKVWSSTIEAGSIFDNPKAARAAISNVCNKTTRQAYGYYWSFKRKFEYTPYGVAVAMYDDDGIFIKSFSKLKDATKELNLKSSTNILDCIKGKQKHCKGYRWRYFYGNTSNIEPLNT